MKRGFFDDTGKCVLTISGEGEGPVGLVEKPVPDDATPNTIELKGGKPVKKEHKIEKPQKTGPNLAERVALLEAQVAALQEIVQP